VRRLPIPLPPRHPGEPVLRRRDWTFPAPPVRRELVEVLPDEPDPAKPPLLFVHGAWHGAWCWREHWMPAAAERGWRTYAVSLRGHGGSEGADALTFAPLRYYEHDVLQAITELPAPPVLVGHSMGGLVVQHVLERYRSAPAGVLVSPVPPGHGLEVLAAMARHHPASLVKALAGARPDAAAFFGPRADEVTVRRTQERLDDESWLATQQLVLPRRARTSRAPVLVLGGGDDTVTPPSSAVRTARHYGTKARLFRGMGHDLMLEPDWRAPLDAMLDWLGFTLDRR
jgi:pimeloyl-ACP methyl ester carboxylesterase